MAEVRPEEVSSILRQQLSGFIRPTAPAITRRARRIVEPLVLGGRRWRLGRRRAGRCRGLRWVHRGVFSITAAAADGILLTVAAGVAAQAAAVPPVVAAEIAPVVDVEAPIIFENKNFEK